MTSFDRAERERMLRYKPETPTVEQRPRTGRQNRAAQRRTPSMVEPITRWVQETPLPWMPGMRGALQTPGSRDDRLDLYGPKNPRIGQFGEEIDPVTGESAGIFDSLEQARDAYGGPYIPGQNQRRESDLREEATIIAEVEEEMNFNFTLQTQEELTFEREEIAETIAALKDQHSDQSEYAQLAQVIMDGELVAMFGTSSLVPDDDELSLAMREDMIIGDQTGGLSSNIIEGINAILASDMDKGEKNARIDYIFERLDIQYNVNKNLADLTEEMTAWEKLAKMDDYELAGAQGIRLEFINPTVWDVMIPSLPNGYTVGEAGNAIMSGAILEAGDMEFKDLPDTDIDKILEIMFGDRENGIVGTLEDPLMWENSATESALAAIADNMEIPLSTLINKLKNIQSQAQSDANRFTEVFNEGSMQSDQVAYAVYRVGREILGLSDGQAKDVAFAKDLELIVNAFSRGKVFYEGNGSRVGLFGLKRDWIEQTLGMPYEEAVEKFGKVQADVIALYAYVDQMGGIHQAMNRFKSTRSWG